MFWRNFKKRHPKKDGWYIVTVEVERTQRYTMMLWWDKKYGRFKDNVRQHIFDLYNVYGYDKKKKLYTCDLCDRTEDIVYWKPAPKPCMRGFIKDKLYS